MQLMNGKERQFSYHRKLTFFYLIFIEPSKMYWIGNSSTDYKSAQKGISFNKQTAGRDDFIAALYEDEIRRVYMENLRLNKISGQMAIFKLNKSGLSNIYLKYYLVDRVLCKPYE